MINKIILLFFLLSTPLYAAEVRLADGQLERVQIFKHILQEVDAKPLSQTVSQITLSAHPEGQLQIFEAVAKTYADIVRDYSMEEVKEKKRLYGMILLNMAYFQFGGQRNDDQASHLNRLIQQKLQEYLSPEVLQNRQLFRAIE